MKGRGLAGRRLDECAQGEGIAPPEGGERVRKPGPVPPVLPDARDVILRAGLRPLCLRPDEPDDVRPGFAAYRWHDDPAERAVSVRQGVARALLARAGVCHGDADVAALAVELGGRREASGSPSPREPVDVTGPQNGPRLPRTGTEQRGKRRT